MLETSPFFNPGARSKRGSLALLSLGRDQLPVLLRAAPDPTTTDPDAATAPPEEIVNTRFGSYPHSTLTDVPWGAQVSASNVGAVERRRGKRRRLQGADEADEGSAAAAAAAGGEAAVNGKKAGGGSFEVAASGFAHLATPTPEAWTHLLQHRTQVVYVPDYAYILHLLRARPGCRLIECGAGSGSFTHAAARAVFSGYPAAAPPGADRNAFGKVFSFEYHEQRSQILRREIAEHGLAGVVRVTHRDVYDGGFALDDEPTRADAIFLDLPAPWSAPTPPPPPPPSANPSPQARNPTPLPHPAPRPPPLAAQPLRRRDAVLLLAVHRAGAAHRRVPARARLGARRHVGAAAALPRRAARARRPARGGAAGRERGARGRRRGCRAAAGAGAQE
jgi:tRNA (adenine57-N1/adenine58-N1)-methyltransferase